MTAASPERGGPGVAGIAAAGAGVAQPAALADKQAITEVLHAYCLYLDKMDLDALAGLFTPGCVVDYGPEERFRSDGSAGLRRDLERMWRWARTFHLLGNVSIALSGDEAEATSSVLAWHERPDKTTATMMGQYHDRLLRHEGRWRIDRRRQVLQGNDAGFDVNINRFERMAPPERRSERSG